MTTLSKDAGKYLLWSLNYQAYSPDLKLNDLGYLKRSDWRYGNLWVQARKDDRPFGLLRSCCGTLNLSRNWNFHQDELIKEMRIDMNFFTRNWWYFDEGVGHDWQTYDDRATRGGPLLLNPANSWAYVCLKSDSRNPIVLNPNMSLWRTASGSQGGDVSCFTVLNILSNIRFSFGPEYSWSFDRAQWITNVDQNVDGIFDHFVFGELRSKTLNLTARADITVTPNLSFQLYTQPFLAAGHYEEIKELLHNKSYDFGPYNLGYSPDFNMKSLRGNAVFRWEYRPGSTLFLVWTQNRYNDVENPGDFSPRRDLFTLFLTQSENVFMLKVNYWFNL